MAELVVEKVVKRYGEKIAIKDLVLKVESAELFCILGPPGAGKSSLLKMIAGIESTTSGDIFVDKKRFNDLEPQARDVAMAFESYALYPHLSVFENIAFPLKAPSRLRFSNRSEIKKKVLEVAKLLEIDMLLDRRPRELSGGQRQRVGLGRCLIRNPTLFLLDEPIAHLDAKLKHALKRKLKRWQKEKKITMLYTTTDYGEAFSVGDRIGILNEGELLQIGTQGEIYNHPATTGVGNIISDPPMNYIQGKLITEADKTYFKHKDIIFSLPDELQKRVRSLGLNEAILGIFPSNIILSKKGFGRDFPGTTLSGVINFVRIVGSKKIAFVKDAGGINFAGVIPMEEELLEDEKVFCLFKKDAIQIFDNKSLKNILYI